MDTQPDTTATTLGGDELPEEQDPHSPSPRDDRRDSDSSIYPIETTFGIKMQLQSPGKNPFHPSIYVELPFGVDNIPSSRMNEAREDIRKKVDYSQPRIGELGTITFAETTHNIQFHPEDKTHTLELGEWIFEQFYYFLENTDQKAFKDTSIPDELVLDVQETIIENLPGKFITVGGDCAFCDGFVEQTKYVSDPSQTSTGAICPECEKGTVYDKLEANADH